MSQAGFWDQPFLPESVERAKGVIVQSKKAMRAIQVSFGTNSAREMIK